jgi:telomere length regulation protein
MMAGMTISKLIDPQDSRMTFSDESMDTPEGKWYQNLPYIEDKPSKTLDYQFLFNKKDGVKSATPSTTSLPLRQKGAIQPKLIKSMKERHQAPTKALGKIVQLIEEEDDDLVPYAKPDSDPEDDDEDPTLVNREKLRPPV